MTGVQNTSNQLIVTFDDVKLMPMVKKAISLMRGVQSVKSPRVKKARPMGIDKALEDVREGRVTQWASVDEMFDTILK